MRTRRTSGRTSRGAARTLSTDQTNALSPTAFISTQTDQEATRGGGYSCGGDLNCLWLNFDLWIDYPESSATTHILTRQASFSPVRTAVENARAEF